jgi:hypothetical protein
LPQGCAKKIQLKLLLTYLAFQRGNPLRPARRIVQPCAVRQLGAWSPRRTKRASTASRVLRPPLVQKLPTNPQLAGERPDVPGCLKPRQGHKLELSRK